MINKWTLDQDCNDLAALLTERLEGQGLTVRRSFDLRSAREMLREPENCPCPSHGTSDCACQYVVLLIGGRNESPFSLVAHGHDGMTILSYDPSEARDMEPAVLEKVHSAIGMLVADFVG